MVKEMACISKQETNQMIELVEVYECEEPTPIEVNVDIDDRDSRHLRRYLAQQESLRQLERLKTNAFVTTHVISFIR